MLYFNISVGMYGPFSFPLSIFLVALNISVSPVRDWKKKTDCATQVFVEALSASIDIGAFLAMPGPEVAKYPLKHQLPLAESTSEK